MRKAKNVFSRFMRRENLQLTDRKMIMMVMWLSTVVRTHTCTKQALHINIIYQLEFHRVNRRTFTREREREETGEAISR